jgi:adenylate cyclase
VESSPDSRRLVAILAADVAGYSRLIAQDEEGTLRLLSAYRAVISDLATEHSGRIFGRAGDGFVVEFLSAVQAVRAAVAIQQVLLRHNSDLPTERRMEFRMGINLGDVVAQGEDRLGHGVNVARVWWGWSRNIDQDLTDGYLAAACSSVGVLRDFEVES